MFSSISQASQSRHGRVILSFESQRGENQIRPSFGHIRELYSGQERQSSRLRKQVPRRIGSKNGGVSPQTKTWAAAAKIKQGRCPAQRSAPDHDPGGCRREGLLGCFLSR